MPSEKAVSKPAPWEMLPDFVESVDFFGRDSNPFSTELEAIFIIAVYILENMKTSRFIPLH